MPNLTPEQLEDEMECERIKFERWRQVRRAMRPQWAEREDQHNDPRHEMRVRMPTEEDLYE